jgi:type IX secretion system PorP/SprF family membrane protein
LITFDHYIEKYNSGIGFSVLDDKQGSNRIKNTEFSLSYAYQQQIAESSFIRFGIQGTRANKSYDLNGLVFGDQITSGGITNPTSYDPLKTSKGNAAYIDFNSGALLYSPKGFLGVSVSHLVKSKIEYQSTTPNTLDCTTGDCLPSKISINGGWNINLDNPYGNAANADKEFTLTPSFLYKKQGKFSQLDLGAYVTYSPLTFGLFYRGIPIKKKETTRYNHDSIIALAGYRLDNFSFGYSYDLTVSGLGIQTGGSHEISIAYQFEAFESERTSPYKKRLKKQLSCPKF